MNLVFQAIIYFAVAGLFVKYFLAFQEQYIDFITDDNDDPKKYLVQGNAVMEDAIYVTNPESLYSGFSLEVGKQKQKIPFGPITDRLGNVRTIPGLPNRDILYTIKDDSNYLTEKIPLPGSSYRRSTSSFPL